MIETTAIALLMFINGEIKEHRIQPSMSVCLKHKREASRQIKDNIDYKCIKSKVELEENIDGSKTIRKIILK
jgi:hypothetical protein|tara:strand:+ start:388 stop:603 length:216 start_codon:yes stop_codon:yes gene_type:complete